MALAASAYAFSFSAAVIIGSRLVIAVWGRPALTASSTFFHWASRVPAKAEEQTTKNRNTRPAGVFMDNMAELLEGSRRSNLTRKFHKSCRSKPIARSNPEPATAPFEDF